MDSSTSSDSFDRDGGETKERVPDTLDKESDSREEKENWNNCESPEQEALVTELNKIESEMRALREVLARKQRRANEIRSILGNPIVNDVKEKLKSLQDSEALQKTNQAFKSAGEKTSAAFSNIGKRFVDVRTKIGVSIGSSLNNVKARMNNGSRSDGLPGSNRNSLVRTDSLVSSTIDEEVEPGY